MDGNDAVAVHEAAVEAVAGARAGTGPTLIVATTYRFGGHYVGDPEEYRDEEEVESWRGRDPIPRLEALLIRDRVLDETGRARVWEEALAEVTAAERFAEASPNPIRLFG